MARGERERADLDANHGAEHGPVQGLVRGACAVDSAAANLRRTPDTMPEFRIPAGVAKKMTRHECRSRLRNAAGWALLWLLIILGIAGPVRDFSISNLEEDSRGVRLRNRVPDRPRATGGAAGEVLARSDARSRRHAYGSAGWRGNFRSRSRLRS